MKPAMLMSEPMTKPLLTLFIASPAVPLSPAFTLYVLMMLAITPMARTNNGKITPFVAEAGDAQNHRGDDRDFVAFENVGRHTGAVADVIADVIGNRGGVTRIVFGNAGFQLSDQVGPHVGRFGVNAAADSHEQGQQRAAEAEAQQGLVGVFAVDQEDDRAAQQSQAVGQHAGDRAGAISQLQRRRQNCVWAAAATRKLPTVANRMPMKPTVAENVEPTKKAIARPQAISGWAFAAGGGKIQARP